jgi:hypothetical protein
MISPINGDRLHKLGKILCSLQFSSIRRGELMNREIIAAAAVWVAAVVVAVAANGLLLG